MGFLDLQVTCGVKIENCIWGSARWFNGLIKIKLDSMKAEYVCDFPNEDIGAMSLHSKAITKNEKIFFLPGKSRYVHIVDIKTLEIQVIGLEIFNYEKEYYAKEDKKTVYLIPKMVGGDILKLNLETLKMDVLIEWKRIEDRININNDFVFLRVAKYNNKLKLPIHNSSEIIIIDVNNQVISVKNATKSKWLGAIDSKNGAWLLSNESPNIYHWNIEEDSIKEYKHYSIKELDNKKPTFTYGIEMEDKVYFIPSYSYSEIGCIKNNNFEAIYLYEKYKSKILFAEPFCDENIIWILPMDSDKLISIKDGVIQEYLTKKVNIEEKRRQEILKSITKSTYQSIHIENDILTLEEFLEGLVLF